MSLTKFLNDYTNEQLKKVEQGFISKIVSFDRVTMRAEITPLLQFTSEIEGEEKTIQAPNIKNVPCEILYAGGCYIRPVYAPGDLVNCSLKSSNITKPLDSNLRADINENRFSLSFCTITGGVIPKGFNAPEAWGDKEGLLIGFGENEVIEVLMVRLK